MSQRISLETDDDPTRFLHFESFFSENVVAYIVREIQFIGFRLDKCYLVRHRRRSTGSDVEHRSLSIDGSFIESRKLGEWSWKRNVLQLNSPTCRSMFVNVWRMGKARLNGRLTSLVSLVQNHRPFSQDESRSSKMYSQSLWTFRSAYQMISKKSATSIRTSIQSRTHHVMATLLLVSSSFLRLKSPYCAIWIVERIQKFRNITWKSRKDIRESLC